MVAPDCPPDTVWLDFFEATGESGAEIRCSATFWHCGGMDEADCVRSFDVSIHLGEAADFCVGVAPDRTVAALTKLAIFGDLPVSVLIARPRLATGMRSGLLVKGDCGARASSRSNACAHGSDMLQLFCEEACAVALGRDDALGAGDQVLVRTNCL